VHRQRQPAAATDKGNLAEAIAVDGNIAHEQGLQGQWRLQQWVRSAVIVGAASGAGNGCRGQWKACCENTTKIFLQGH
jgi:hypothetical protein